MCFPTKSAGTTALWWGEITVIRHHATTMLPRFLTLLLMGAIFQCFGQAPTSPQKAPSKVIEEFWNVETGGGRLTPDGWYGASRFFIRSGLFPGRKVINVIRNGHANTIEETARTATWAEVSVTTDRLGEIDPSMRFSPSMTRGPGGVTLLKGPVLTFDLVLTEKQWKLNKDGSREKESVVPLQWLITCDGDNTWVNLDTAIAYVRGVQSKTKDPVLRRNTGITLRRLMQLQ